MHGPLARDAEDAALLLDAMVGLYPLSPISVAPPWQSALAELERRDDIKGLRVAYVSDIAGIGVEAEINSICRDAAADAWPNSARRWSRSHSMRAPPRRLSDLARLLIAGQQLRRLAKIDRLGPNLRGNIEAGLKLKSLDFPPRRRSARRCINRFRTVRALRCLAHAGGAGKTVPVEKNFPDRINGRALENYIDWFAPTTSVTLMSLPAASAPAGLSQDGLPVGMQIVAPRFEEPLILRVARLIHQASGVGWPPIAEISK